MSSLDEILKDLAKETNGISRYAIAKAQIKALVAKEIIGKTEVEPATPYGAVLAVQHRNALRDKQKRKLESA